MRKPKATAIRPKYGKAPAKETAARTPISERIRAMRETKATRKR